MAYDPNAYQAPAWAKDLSNFEMAPAWQWSRYGDAGANMLINSPLSEYIPQNAHGEYAWQFDAKAPIGDAPMPDGYNIGWNKKDNYGRAVLLDPQGNPVSSWEGPSHDSLRHDDYATMAMIASAALAGPMAGYLGGGAATVGSSAATGAMLGGANGAISSGGDWKEALKGAAVGGIGGAAMGYMGGAGSADPYGPNSGWGQDTLSNMGNPGLSGGVPQVTNSGIGELQNPDGVPNPIDEYMRSGASDMSTNGGNGGYAGAVGQDAGRELLGTFDPSAYGPSYTQTPEAAQTVTVEGSRIPVDVSSQAEFGPPQQISFPPMSDMTTPTPAEAQAPEEQPKASESSLDQLRDWALRNPTQAIQAGGLLATLIGGGGGGGGNGTPAYAPGSQAGMTATPPPALNRQYVAPPAGYRPGFDAEHRYFTGIGAVGSGQTGGGQKSPQDDTTPGNRG